MDFRLSEEQRDLREQAQRLFGEKFSPLKLREAEASAEGFPQTLWEAGSALGWPGLPIGEEFGGQDRTLVDTCVLLEEAGRMGAALPLVVSTGVAGTMLELSPQGAERDRLLRAITSGGIVAPALIDEHARNEWDPPRSSLLPADGGYLFSGTKVLVPFGAVADELLVTASTEDGGTAIVAVQPTTDGVAVTRHHAKVGVPLAMVGFAEVFIPADRAIYVGGEARAALEAGLATGSLLSTAEAVGMCEALISLTSAYVAQREAFGQPIGAFQAVAHPCADMRVSADAIRILVQQAAWLVDNGLDAAEEIPATKALANEHFERVGNDAYRLHGALAFSTECDVQLFMRRLQGFFGSFGETQESFERAASALGMS